MKTALILAAIVLTATTPAFAKKSTFSELSATPTGTGPGTTPNTNSFWNNIGTVGSGSQIPQDVSPAPEPGEWAMMIAGLAVVGFVARRRQS